MPVFIYRGEPRSYNSKGRKKYQEDLRQRFEALTEKPPVRNDSLYGFVYYFHRTPTTIDADNLSKPVWDALKNQAYNDDGQITIRYAGKRLMSQVQALVVETKHFDDYSLDQFSEALENDDHVLYVEWDTFAPSLFKFGPSNT